MVCDQHQLIILHFEKGFSKTAQFFPLKRVLKIPTKQWFLTRVKKQNVGCKLFFSDAKQPSPHTWTEMNWSRSALPADHNHAPLTEADIMAMRGKMQLKELASKMKPGLLIDSIQRTLPDEAARHGKSRHCLKTITVISWHNQLSRWSNNTISYQNDLMTINYHNDLTPQSIITII